MVGPETNKNAEFFSPPYLFNSAGLATRPVISAAPDEAPYGAEVIVKKSSGGNISRVTLIKTGAVTHGFNMEQRFVELDFEDVNGGVRVSIPESANIATPGHYMMFLLNDQGVPSEAHIIRISQTATYELPPYPVAIADDGAASAGQSITLNVLSNDSGEGLSVNSFNAYSANGGTITRSGNNLVYTAPAGANGTDTFWYVIEDDFARTNSAKVSVVVSGGTNNPYPVGAPDSADAVAGQAITVDVLSNDTGNGLTLVEPNPWSMEGGNVALVNNQLVYTAKSDFNGEDKIWYTFSDVEDRQSWGEVTLTVTGGGETYVYPVGNPDAANVGVGGTVIVDVLANDAGSGLVLEAPSAYSLQGGTVSVANNKIVFTAKAGFSGEDKIWYTFSDSQGASNWGEVTITVQ